MQANKLKVLVAAIALSTPLMAHAASSSNTGPSNVSTTVDLIFTINVPRFIFLQVGSVASVNNLIYNPSVAAMVNPTPVLATTGGDVAPTDVTYRILGNSTGMTLSASALTLSGPGTMLSSTLTGAFDTGTLNPPAWAGSVSVPSSSGITNQAGTWRYSWQNPADTLFAAGSYTGTATFTLLAP